MSKFRETLSAIKLFGLPRVFYWRLIYRHHMRWVHKRGRHKFKTRPIDGLQHCDWCGAFEPQGLYAHNLLRDAWTAAKSGVFRDGARLSIEAHPAFQRIAGFLGEAPPSTDDSQAQAMQRRA